MEKQRQRLTYRQREVLVLVALGKTNREIAQELLIAPDTARQHVVRLMGRLGAVCRAQLATYACLGFLPTKEYLESRTLTFS